MIPADLSLTGRGDPGQEELHLIDAGDRGLRALFFKWILLVSSRLGLRAVLSLLAECTVVPPKNWRRGHGGSWAL